LTPVIGADIANIRRICVLTPVTTNIRRICVLTPVIREIYMSALSASKTISFVLSHAYTKEHKSWEGHINIVSINNI
jgi:hypothetical protein